MSLWSAEREPCWSSAAPHGEPAPLQPRGSWQGSGDPPWRPSAHSPVGSRAEGRCSQAWKCAAGSPPVPLPRDLPAHGAGVHTNLCFADMPSASHSRPRLPRRHGLPLLILARSRRLCCQFTPTCAIRPGTWWQGLGQVAHPLRQSFHQKEVQRG